MIFFMISSPESALPIGLSLPSERVYRQFRTSGHA